MNSMRAAMTAALQARGTAQTAERDRAGRTWQPEGSGRCGRLGCTRSPERAGRLS
jgi:hypothetical protein